MKNYVLKNGTEIDICEMINIINYYEKECTKEFLLENDYATENNADEMASEVRRIMNKCGFTEENAIFEVIEKYKN